MTIKDFKFAGKKAIVRVDFNVPLDENGKITDDTRIRGALPTLKYILDEGGALIIMSHMGKPKGKVQAKYSLSQIKDAVAAALGRPVQFAEDCAKAQVPLHSDVPFSSLRTALKRRTKLLHSNRVRYCCSRTSVSIRKRKVNR